MIQTFKFTADDGSSLSDVAYLDTLVAAIKTSTMLDTIASMERVSKRRADADFDEAMDPEEYFPCQRLLDQIEHANVLVFDELGTVPTEIVSHLAVDTGH